MHKIAALFALSSILAICVQAIPTLYDIECNPAKVELGSSVNITWKLREDKSKPSRGVFSWQIYAQNAVTKAFKDESGIPVNGPQSTNLLTDGVITGDLNWYQYGPHGLVNYTNQKLCLSTSLPYGKDVDGLGNPEGYSEQTFCPLDCRVKRPSRNYTYFTKLDFTPKRVHVGDSLKITWKYKKGFNFPDNVLLSIFFYSEYFEELPQYVINNVDAKKGVYNLRVGQALRSFVTKNAAIVKGKFPYRLYMQLTFPPQTNVLGNVAAPGNLTILGRQPCAKNQSGCRKRTNRFTRLADIANDAMFESE
ncbi:uncharacterized protein EV422DRAFT_526195 [Fimicolochytrium jonesii]|uniref:uncharacterized protein n=1 Tax=Fimicolochytrium jonesii TaxID=1396493 RepID=UPI0022FDFDFC|nr:uncharacterized protein EV422DRAFT_526195 [Fimicolochytrium jonesii]KAI8822248.1 hypothetical protein EV422DRAFT_526195 [Fimicolochytrium jonesii]